MILFWLRSCSFVVPLWNKIHVLLSQQELQSSTVVCRLSLGQEQNFTPLLWAAAGGHFQATKSLLEAVGSGSHMKKSWTRLLFCEVKVAAEDECLALLQTPFCLFIFFFLQLYWYCSSLVLGLSWIIPCLSCKLIISWYMFAFKI